MHIYYKGIIITFNINNTHLTNTQLKPSMHYISSKECRVSKFWLLSCPVDFSLLPDGSPAHYELRQHLSILTVMTLTASNEIFPHKCYLPLSPVTLPLMSSTSQFDAAVTFCSLWLPPCSQRGLWKKSSHTHSLDIDISDSSLGSLWPNGHSFSFFFLFLQIGSHVEGNKCSHGFLVNRNVIRPPCISVSRRGRHHSRCSVTEG